MHRPLGTALALVLLAAPYAAPAAAQESGETGMRVVRYDPETLQSRRAAVRDSSAERAQQSTPRDVPMVTSRLLLPHFLVNRMGFDITTLWAVRNDWAAETITVDVTYWSATGMFLTDESIIIDPFETVTRNLRDVPGLTAEGDGFARGYVTFETEFADIGGEFVQIDFTGDFAQGERLIDLDGVHLCEIWGGRLAVGGPLLQNTSAIVFVTTALGNDPDTDDPTYELDIFDEPGTYVGTVLIFPNRVSEVIDLEDILQTLEDEMIVTPNFGSFEVIFNPGSGDGLLLVRMGADNRYSATSMGICIF